MKRVIELISTGHQLEAAWVPGHSDFPPNEKADKIAKEAAEESHSIRYPAEKKEILAKLKDKVKENWQFRMDLKLVNHRIAEGLEKVGMWYMHKLEGIHILYQLASGHCKLNH